MERITEKMLQRKVDYLNTITGNPLNAWEKTDSGIRANVGNYHISGAYGGVCLHQMDNEYGGVRSVFNCGHVPKRDLWNRLCAYTDGIEAR